MVAPASLGSTFDAALAVITHNFGAFYLWVVLALVGLCGLRAFSRYGNLRLGAEDEKPDYSTGAWFSMLFAAGMGIGLVFWSVAEPLLHFATPPPGIAAGTPEAANAAMRYSFFHWGLHPWAIYAVVALAIGYFQFRRGGAALVSTATESLPWRPVQRLSPLFDVPAVIVMIGVMLVGSFVLDLFGISLPIVRIGGGLIVVATGWRLLGATHAVSDSQQQLAESCTPEKVNHQGFYPLTFPISCGPGSIAAAITVGVSLTDARLGCRWCVSQAAPAPSW